MSLITSAATECYSENVRSRSGSKDDASKPPSLLALPAEMVLEIFSHLSLKDVGRMQQVSKLFYTFILNDPSFTYYNTVKFFELYYQRETLAVYLFPYINPRMSYYGLDRLKKKQQGSRSLVPNGDDLAAGNTVFHIAAANGLVTTIEHYLTREKERSLHFSSFDQRLCYNREASEIIRLKDENRDCLLAEMENDEPNTALHYISIIPEATNVEDVLKVAQLLFRQGGIDYNRKGRAGNTALCEAAQHGQEEMVQLIVNEVRRRLMEEATIQEHNLGSPFSDRSGRRHSRSGRDYLHLAGADRRTSTQHNVEEIVKMRLVRYINTVNDYSENAVILSARACPPILHYLLAQGGDPNSSRRGSPLIHIVCSMFLLDRQDPDFFRQYHDDRSTNGGRTHERGFVLSSELLQNEDLKGKAVLYKQVLKSLLQFGADPHVRHANSGMKPLHMAAFWGNTDAIEILIKEQGIDPNREVNLYNNWLPMHYACDESQLFAIYVLLSNGAFVWDSQEAISVRNRMEESDNEGQDVLDQVKRHSPSPLDLVRVDDHRVRVLMLNQALQSRRSVPE